MLTGVFVQLLDVSIVNVAVPALSATPAGGVEGAVAASARRAGAAQAFLDALSRTLLFEVAVFGTALLPVPLLPRPTDPEDRP